MMRDRTTLAAGSSAAVGANNTGAMGGYDAYFGTYTLDAMLGTITVCLEGALTPANLGGRYTREIRVEEDRLTIQLATTAHDGTPVTRTLVFARIA